jgi:hypothetical protein
MIHYFIVTPSVTFLTYVDGIVKNEIKIKKAMPFGMLIVTYLLFHGRKHSCYHDNHGGQLCGSRTIPHYHQHGSEHRLPGSHLKNH